MSVEETASPGTGPGLAGEQPRSAVLMIVVALLTLPAARPIRRLVVLLVVASQRQPVLGARWRLRHRPAVGLADAVGALPVGAPTVAEVVLGLAVALLVLPVALPVGWLGRRGAGLLPAGGRVGVGRPGTQRLRHPPLANRARPGALGVLVGLPLAVGEPLGQPRDWRVRVPADAGGAAVGVVGEISLTPWRHLYQRSTRSATVRAAVLRWRPSATLVFSAASTRSASRLVLARSYS